jgi:xeroderma pigmentosum group C-complementing protein
LKGIVLATEYRDAVEAVIEGFLDEKARIQEEARTVAALRLWKRFLVGLRIKERVATYEIEGEEDEEEEVQDELRHPSEDDDDDGMESEEYIDDGAGGFFIE